MVLLRFAPILLLTACAVPRRALTAAPEELAQVAELRGYAAAGPLRLNRVGETVYQKAVADWVKRHPVDRKTHRGLDALDDAARGPSMEPTVGFYDFSTRTIWLRQGQQTSGAEWHELAHAVSDQRFGLERFLAVEDDAWLAREAFLEGEAELTATVMLAGRKPVLAAAVAREKILAADVLGPLNPDNAETPFQSYQYSDGLRFALALFQAGGFAYVDRAFAHPPVSSAQILHPEKYAAGVLPLSVAAPALPNELTAESTGTLGEAGITLWLAHTLSYLDAREAVRGWSGDRYTVAHLGGTRVLLVSLVMEDEESARRVEQSFVKLPELRVQRRGVRLAVVRGPAAISSAALTALEESLFAAPVQAAYGLAPLGPPLVAQVVRAIAASEPQEVSLPKLGVIGMVPVGFSSYQGVLSSAAIGIRAFGRTGIVMLTPPIPEAPKSNPRPVRSALGDGVVAEVKELRMYTIPACEGRAMLVFLSFASDSARRDELDAWFRSFRPAPDRATGCPVR